MFDLVTIDFISEKDAQELTEMGTATKSGWYVSINNQQGAIIAEYCGSKHLAQKVAANIRRAVRDARGEA